MSKFLSRKLLVLLITGLIGMLGAKIGLTPETIDIVATAAVTYLIGQSAVDAVTAFKAPPSA